MKIRQTQQKSTLAPRREGLGNANVNALTACLQHLWHVCAMKIFTLHLTIYYHLRSAWDSHLPS